ncbi:hypothetical protein EJB05_13677 [Eragrostis curvula]|uniref:Protein kinase domain-containing protein n=1 Tax=Eragrostis curvula TaxID=38414 RepID=A0A5J9VXZ8_9POAL|nr:hypothetical protein EJB05_13677 [Eragrostis curvula]
MRIKFICNFGGVFLPRPSDGELRYVGGERHLVQINRDMSWYELTCKTTTFIRRHHTIKYHLPGEQLNMLISITSDDDLRNMIEECIALEQNKERLTMYLFSDDDDQHRVHFVVARASNAEKEAKFIALINGLISPSKALGVQNLGSTSTNDLQQALFPSHSMSAGPPKISSVQPEKTLPTPSFLTRMARKEYRAQISDGDDLITSDKNMAGVQFGSSVTSESMHAAKRETPIANDVSRQQGLQRTTTIMIEMGHQARGAKGLPRKEMLMPLDNSSADASSLNSNNSSLTPRTKRSTYEIPASLLKDSQKTIDQQTRSKDKLKPRRHSTQEEGVSHSAVDPLRKKSNLQLQINKMEMQEPSHESGTVQCHDDVYLSANVHIPEKSVAKNNREKQQPALPITCTHTKNDTYSKPTSNGGDKVLSCPFTPTMEPKPNILVRASSERRLERSNSPRPDEQSSKIIKSRSVGAGGNSLQIGSSSPEVEDNAASLISEVEDYETKKNEKGLPKDAVLGRGLTSNVQIIRNEDLEDLREIGSGAFGMVFYGKWKGTDVAIKRIKNSCFMVPSTQADKLITEFWREAAILSKLHHPNILAFYGVVNDGPGGTLATVTEFMVNGSLKKVLLRIDKYLDWRKTIMVAMDAAIGMEYLHSKNIVHFDLKCDNLLVNVKDPSRPICKVADFGLSKMKQATLVSGGMRGTLPWMAPELLTMSGTKVSEKIDVYSFGVVMWEILTGEDPYDGMHYGGVIGGILSNTLRPPVPGSCNPEWRRLMEQCWSTEPERRPSFTEVASRLRAILEASH